MNTGTQQSATHLQI